MNPAQPLLDEIRDLLQNTQSTSCATGYSASGRGRTRLAFAAQPLLEKLKATTHREPKSAPTISGTRYRHRFRVFSRVASLGPGLFFDGAPQGKGAPVKSAQPKPGSRAGQTSSAFLISMSPMTFAQTLLSKLALQDSRRREQDSTTTRQKQDLGLECSALAAAFYRIRLPPRPPQTQT